MRPVIALRYPGRCADCGTDLPVGAQARYYGQGRVYGVGCHQKGDKAPMAVGLLDVLLDADKAAAQAFNAFCQEHYRRPAFAVVENSPSDGIFYNPKTPTRVFDQMYDVCGNVWLEVNFKEGQRLIKEFKAQGHLQVKEERKEWELGAFHMDYRKSHSVWSTGWVLSAPNVGYGNGAMSAAKDAGRAFAGALKAAGYPGVSMRSMID